MIKAKFFCVLMGVEDREERVYKNNNRMNSKGRKNKIFLEGEGGSGEGH